MYTFWPISRQRYRIIYHFLITSNIYLIGTSNQGRGLRGQQFPNYQNQLKTFLALIFTLYADTRSTCLT